MRFRTNTHTFAKCDSVPLQFAAQVDVQVGRTKYVAFAAQGPVTLTTLRFAWHPAAFAANVDAGTLDAMLWVAIVAH